MAWQSRLNRIRERLARARRGASRGGDEPGHVRGSASAGLASALARARAGLDRAGAGAGKTARSVGDAISGTWFAIPLAVRQRLAAGAALLATIAVIVFVLIPAAPCSVPGGDRCPPSDDAIALVPTDAGAYVHLNVGTDTDQYENARSLAERLPELAGAFTSLLSTTADLRIDYERDIRPWSGGELALVIALNGTEVGRMLMFEANDGEAAGTFAEAVLGRGTKISDVNGITMRRNADGLAAAVRAGFLLLGPEAQVRESIELSRADSLAVNQVAQQALEQLPSERLLEAYISPAFTGAAVASGALAGLDTFVDAEASEGAAAALVIEEDGLELAVRSILDPDRSEASPGFFAALPAYEPTLTADVQGDALVYLGVGDPGASAATLVGRAASTAPDLFGGLEQFNRRLRRQDKINVERDLVPLLEGEAALTVEPEKAPGDDGGEQPEGVPGVVEATGVPYLALLAKGVDVPEALADLAELQGPIADAIDISAGQSPVFETREIGGLEAQSLRLSRVVDLTYAGADDQLIVATSPAAIERLASDEQPLADSDGFRAATESFDDQVSMLVYLDLPDLLSLGERLFLAEDPSYARYALDLRTLGAAALAVTYSPSQLSTDARVLVGEGEAPDPELEPPADVGLGG